MNVKVTNVSYIIGGGKVNRKYRNRQNITFWFENDYTDDEVLNIISNKGYFPSKTSKIIRL